MGFSSEKSSPQIEGGLESSADSNNNNRKWVIALRAPLKPIYTTITIPKKAPPQEEEEEEEEECSSNSTATTPTGEEAKVPTRLTCPPAPRKQKAAPLKYCNNNSYAASPRDFFNPPDLETLFLPRQRA